MTPVLDIRKLQVEFETREGTVRAVDQVSLSVNRGEVVGLVGESGSGKSVTGMSVMGLIDPPGQIVNGSIFFNGEDLADVDERRMRGIRGRRIAMIFQDPMRTLNPIMTVGSQVVEAIQAHTPISRAAAMAKARDALGAVGIPSPEERLAAFPHHLSGGMRQRVVIAIAMLHNPDLIIADEPTTALDVTIQSQILSEVQRLAKESGTALVWITHDMAIVSSLADRIAVMYAGCVVEFGPVNDVLTAPAHPYTRGLIESVPSRNKRGQRLNQISGTTPSLLALPKGCSFGPRCPQRSRSCDEVPTTNSVGNREFRCFHPGLEVLA